MRAYLDRDRGEAIIKQLKGMQSAPSGADEVSHDSLTIINDSPKRSSLITPDREQDLVTHLSSRVRVGRNVFSQRRSDLIKSLIRPSHRQGWTWAEQKDVAVGTRKDVERSPGSWEDSPANGGK